jgi:hypothetical protein
MVRRGPVSKDIPSMRRRRDVKEGETCENRLVCGIHC